MTVSAAPLGVAPFLDARRIAPGGLIVAVDLGHPWHVDGLRALDHRSTDNRFHLASVTRDHPEAFPAVSYEDDLTSLLRDDRRTWNPEARAAFIPPSMAFADVVLTRFILDAAG